MNLHAIVSGVISAVNPMQTVSLRVSNGYSTEPDGRRVPKYFAARSVTAQVQELTTRDLRQLEGLNIQGSQRAIYVSGEIDAIIRMNQKGGDLIIMPDGSEWLTTQVLEQWPDWCKVSVTLQRRNPSTIPC